MLLHLAFYIDVGDLNSEPHVCKASKLPSTPSPQTYHTFLKTKDWDRNHPSSYRPGKVGPKPLWFGILRNWGFGDLTDWESGELEIR